MPKRTYAGKSNRRPYKRQRRQYNTMDVVPRGLSFPGKPRTAVVLNYTDMVTLNGALGVAAFRRYRLNSLFDPDETGVGAQPVGHDEYSALYSRYTVFKAEVEVHFISGGDSKYVGGFYVLPSNFLSTTSLSDNIARSDKLIFGSSNTGGTTNTRMKQSYYLPTIVGRRYSTGDAQYSALIGANPTETVGLIVYAGGTNDLQDPGPIDCLVRIRYHCIYSEPKALFES